MNEIILLDIPTVSEYSRLLELWEASVHSTHDFLKEADIEFFKEAIIQHNVFKLVNLTCARTSDNIIIGFIGIAEDSLEMLFVDPEFRSKGIGKALLQGAFRKSIIKKVDVNEQNIQAIGFYAHFGFKIVSRSELDYFGKPFPLLHMELETK